MRLNHLDGYTFGDPRAMTRDHYGFLWIGTNDGLLKYDGYSYTRFIPVPGNPNSISGLEIRDILLDSQNRLWIGTTKGLSLFDYRNNRFDNYNPDQVDTTFIYDIFESTDGKIWLASEAGLYQIEENLTFKRYETYIDENSNLKELNYVRTIHQDVDDNLWLGTINSGLLRLDYKSDQFHIFPDTSNLHLIIGLIDLSEKELLVTTYSSGIHLINKQTSSISEFDSGVNNIKVRAAISIDNDEHWIATDKNGVVILKQGSIFTLKKNNIDGYSLSNNQVFSLYHDNHKNVWVGAKDGISVSNLNATVFQNYFYNGTDKGLSTKDIYSIYQDVNGNLLFGTKGFGIDKLLPDGTVQNIRLINKELETIGDNPLSILEVDERLWVATENGLLYSDDGLYFNLIDLSESDADRVLMLHQYSDDGILVAAESGLYLLNTRTFEHQLLDTVPAKFVYSIYQHNNNYWIATDKEVTYLDSELNVIKRYEISELGLSDVSSFEVISEDVVVFGSRKNGLLIFNHAKNFEVKTITEQDNLPSNVIYTLNSDNRNNLWVSTIQGIAKVDLDTSRISTLHREDGIQSEEYNRNAFFKDSLGKFYYGGTEGVTSFYPQRLFKESVIPDVIWSNFKTVINGKQVPGLSDTTVIQGPLNKAYQIELAYGDSATIEFSSNVITKPNRVLFETRLNASSEEDKWIDSTDYRSLNITRLSYDTHFFEVRASLNGLDWSEPLGISIIKTPPPWLTWWAYTGYFFVVMLIVSYFFRVQYQKNLDKQRAQKLIKESEERLKLALWGSRDELWDWNLVSGKIHRSNTWGILNFPKRETDESGKNSIFRNIHPKDLPSVRAALDDHRNGYTSHYEATYRIKDRDENWVWILDRGKIVEHDDDGKPLRMSGTIRNITDIKDTQEQLDLIAKAFENTSDGVFILDNEFKYQAVNKAYEKITGFKAQDRKYKLFDIHSEHRTAKDVLHQIRQALILDGAWQGELEDTRASGEAYTIELKLDAVRDRLDEVTHYVGVFSDITYRKKAEQDLRRMANFDQLTGLPNRSLFQDRLKHAIALSDRTSKELILLFIDLDNFKVVNDSLGHSIGDRLLTKVAERISACVRNNDTVARLGGDEYTILLEQVDGSFVGTRVADKILDALSRPFRIQGHELVIGCSIGIAMYPDDGADVETLLRNADTAMYSAKYMDKNNYQFFTDSMNKKANTRLEMEHELRKAIPAGDIKVVYQPKIDLSTGLVMGCEALARWQHPEFGFVSPEDFITLAEETGLIYSLGESVLHQACEATAEWKENNNYTGRTAVNLSAIQFRQTGLADVVEDILSKHNLSGEDIEFELTEGMLVTNPEAAIQIMKDLRAKGYHLAIDDFGTGYASMAQLKNFPINTLKIDKTFIDDLTKDEQDANLVKAILSLASNLHLSTVAEGVEDAEQVAELQKMGCDNIQGYVYSRPISADDFANLLDENLTLEQQIHKNANKVVNFPA